MMPRPASSISWAMAGCGVLCYVHLRAPVPYHLDAYSDDCDRLHCQAWGMSVALQDRSTLGSE